MEFYERSLDCVHCGLCLPACPTYEELGNETDSPRGRIYLMRAWAEGRLADAASIVPALDRCLDCRACETACPSGVQYGHILEEVRGRLSQELPRTFAAKVRRFLLRRVVAHQGRLRVAFRLARLAQVTGLRWLAERLRLVPPAMRMLGVDVPPAAERRPIQGTFPARGERRGTVFLFTGCVMEQLFGRINQRTVELLTANGFEVVVPSDQGCCGALQVHDGDPETARRLARHNLAAFGEDGIIVNNSAGCGAALKEYGELLGDEAGTAFSARCRDISEFLAEHGLTATPANRSLRAVYDDPCHLCHGQGVRRAPRDLLAQVPGLELVALAGAEDCCGSAGIYNMVQPDLAHGIGARKARALIDSGAEAVVTSNPGCMMQISAHLREQGSPLSVFHIVDLVHPQSPDPRPPRSRTP